MGKNPTQKLAKKDQEAKDKAALSGEPPKKVVKKKKTKLQAKAADRHCKIDKCKRTYRAKGYCNTHYAKWRQGAFGVARYKTCVANDCKKPMMLNRHGYCEEHFQSYYVKGVAAAAAPEAKAPEKKAEKVA